MFILLLPKGQFNHREIGIRKEHNFIYKLPGVMEFGFTADMFQNRMNVLSNLQFVKSAFLISCPDNMLLTFNHLHCDTV